jgi:hypothetical protein
MGFDLPLDAFTLHHPFIHSSATEFEYSEWYFLFFTFFDKSSSSQTIDVSLTVPEIAKSLSSKLSVPASIFSITRAEEYRSNSISANQANYQYTIVTIYCSCKVCVQHISVHLQNAKYLLDKGKTEGQHCTDKVTAQLIIFATWQDTGGNCRK